MRQGPRHHPHWTVWLGRRGYQAKRRESIQETSEPKRVLALKIRRVKGYRECLGRPWIWWDRQIVSSVNRGGSDCGIGSALPECMRVDL